MTPQSKCNIGSSTYKSQKTFAMATSLSCSVSAISVFCWPTTQPSPHKQQPAPYHSQKTSYSNFSPEISCHGNIPQHMWTPIEHMNPWAHPGNPNGISIGSAVFAQMTAACPYTLQWGAPSPPQNCPFPWGRDLDHI